VREAVGETPTDYTYTGQREEAALGLMYYVARWYDPHIAHFVQADTIVPGAGNPAAWDRYAYVMYNPLKYTDPRGYYPVGDDIDPSDLYDQDPITFWINLIENEFSNINIITIDEIGKFCWVGPCVEWTTHELELIYETLVEYPYPDELQNTPYIEILKAKYDKKTERYAGPLNPRTTLDGVRVTLTETAWDFKPNLGLFNIFYPSTENTNYMSSVFHEITHAINRQTGVFNSDVQAVHEQLKNPLERTWLWINYYALYGTWEYNDENRAWNIAEEVFIIQLTTDYFSVK
jgi:RHS repeat-associated protein